MDENPHRMKLKAKISHQQYLNQHSRQTKTRPEAIACVRRKSKDLNGKPFVSSALFFQYMKSDAVQCAAAKSCICRLKKVLEIPGKSNSAAQFLVLR